jgi:putative ABC transport system ATP-binding protein
VTAAPIARLCGATKSYPHGSRPVVALDDVTLELRRGEALSVMGPSGSGKSTLLGILGCLDRPTRGEYQLDGVAVSSLDDLALSRIRNRSIGFVFQAFHLIPQLSVQENVETPLVYGTVPAHEWPERVSRSLARVGLSHRADHRPSELSGGEAQRVAVARALVTDPQILLADEPTGNLDSVTGEEIARLLLSLRSEGKTVIVVTHNESLARRAERLIHLRDGRIEAEERL